MDEDTKTRQFYSLETIVNKLPQIMHYIHINVCTWQDWKISTCNLYYL